MNQNLNVQNNGVINSPFEIFNYQNLGQVRVQVDQYGNTWFCLLDVCNIIGITNPRNLVGRIDDPYIHSMDAGVQTGVFPDGSPIIQIKSMNFVNEAGLYQAIGNSRKPEAKRFMAWIFEEVLPSIRQKGYYTLPSMSPMEMIRTMADEMINMKNDYTNKFQLVDQRISSTDNTVANINDTVNDHTHMIENINNTISLLETEGFFTVSGFARFVSVPLTQELAIHIGKVASEIASNNGIQIGSLPHPEFGSVRLYPYNVISEAFRVSGQVNN